MMWSGVGQNHLLRSGQGTYRSGVNVIGVKALSKYEVEFTLSAPSSIFLKALTLYVPGIYDSLVSTPPPKTLGIEVDAVKHRRIWSISSRNSAPR